MSKIRILDAELEYEFLDADDLEKYQQENDRVVKEFEVLDYDGLSAPEGFRRQCRIINTFFDNVFGAGTAEMLFHGKSNIRDHLDAFAAVTNAAVTSDQEIGALRGKYSPERAGRYDGQQQNRANGGNVSQFNGYQNKKKHR